MKKINAIIINEKDNVATVLNSIKAGEIVICKHLSVYEEIPSVTDIPPYNKISRETINKNSLVMKYGEIIGKATENIPKGSLVSDKNIMSIPRSYDEEML